MVRVGFAGVPGCGKSSTARGLAAFCRGHEKLRKIELVSEYARRYIAKYGVIDCIQDQYRIMQKQIDWEDSIPVDSTDVLISDSPIHMGFLYALDLRKNTTKDAVFLNDIFKRLNSINIPTRYDIIFYLPPFLNPVKDGVRADTHFDKSWRGYADGMIQCIFNIFPPKKFIEIKSKTIEERIQESLKILVDHLKTIN